MGSSSDSETDTRDTVPIQLTETANNIALNLLPTKSRQQYTAAYNEFKKWRKTKNTTSFNEDVFLVYFDELSRTLAPSTMWSRFSMLKATINSYDNINIGTYTKLIAFLKNKNKGHKNKKSKVFSASEVSKFCNDAPDDKFLAAKVIMIMGVAGACRREELPSLSVKNIEDHETMLLVKIPVTKTGIERSFTVVGDFYRIAQKYMKLRPKDCDSDRLFLNYRSGKCTKQPIGINTIDSIPKTIATFLMLSEPDLYTGHSFRRTSATLLSDAGADITTLKRHGGWKSSSVAEGYIEASISNKMKIAEQITNSIAIDQTTSSAIECTSPKRLKLGNMDKTMSASKPSTSTASSDEFSIDNTNKNISFHLNNCSAVTININNNSSND